jgi:fructose-specific phosphotransferase system IIC component
MPLFIGGFLGGVLVGGWLFWQTGTVSLPQVTLTLGGVLLGIILAMFITVAVIKARRPKPASEQTPER